MEPTETRNTIQTTTELRFVKGVGPRRAEKLAELGMTVVEDLLYYLPFRYEDRRSFSLIAALEAGGPSCTIEAEVQSSRLIRTRRRGFTIFEAQLTDASGSIRGVWYNQPYLARVLVKGRRAVLFGRASLDRSKRLTLDNAEYELLDEEDEATHSRRIVPVYRKLADLNCRAIRRLMYATLEALDPKSLAEVLPVEVASRHGLVERPVALRAVHFPPDQAELGELAAGETEAHRRLAFEEIFLLQLALALRRHGLHQAKRGITYEIPDALRTRLGKMLPFKLTAAQKRVLKEIAADLKSSHPMHRLLQGDVGSGKTIVALLTLLVAVENGYQAALMAPTEILADQHYRNIRRLLDEGGVECKTALLTGSLKAAPRRAVLERIRSGDAQLVIGTHALFEAGVEFSRLGLAVVDEQHRFGVMQRVKLAQKGDQPDVLVMTATPIPRSLALTLYGDLDLSVIDELPPGRTPIETRVRSESEREQVYEVLRRALKGGRQAYVVVPLVEESERSDLKAAKEFAEKLRSEVLPDLEVGMVHGRMKAPDKEQAMQAFVEGRTQLLVATTVIEVGVDVPNASVMIVEHAERFGLSQLHQLRGRVGRGSAKSYCVLMVGGEDQGHEARQRLAVMSETTDGFVIAQKDLELRGPGAVFGTQQHGLSDLQFLGVVLRGSGLVEAARLEAQGLVAGSESARKQAKRLLASLRSGWRKRFDLSRVG